MGLTDKPKLFSCLLALLNDFKAVFACVRSRFFRRANALGLLFLLFRVLPFAVTPNLLLAAASFNRALRACAAVGTGRVMIVSRNSCTSSSISPSSPSRFVVRLFRNGVSSMIRVRPRFVLCFRVLFLELKFFAERPINNPGLFSANTFR